MILKRVKQRIFSKAIIKAMLGMSFMFTFLTACSPESIPEGYQPLPKQLPIQSFSLYNQSGQDISNSAFNDKWSLVFFGYTFCPDVCPTTLAEINKVASKVQDDRLQVVLVSVDPERDTAEKLDSYIKYFNPKFQAWSGELTQLESLAAQLHVFFEKQPYGESYLMDHSSQLVLVNPKGEYVGFFPPPHQPEKIAAALGQLM